MAVLFKASQTMIRMPGITNVDGIFCKTYHDNIRYVVGATYRPLNSSPDVFDALKSYLVEHVKPGDRIILNGDFNLPHVDWRTFSLNVQEIGAVK